MGVTWTLLPQERKYQPIIEVGCKGCENIAAVVTNSLYDVGYGERISGSISASKARLPKSVRVSTTLL